MTILLAVGALVMAGNKSQNYFLVLVSSLNIADSFSHCRVPQ